MYITSGVYIYIYVHTYMIVDFYKEVASMMKAPDIVYETEHVWKAVLAVISQAEAVLSTQVYKYESWPSSFPSLV